MLKTKQNKTKQKLACNAVNTNLILGFGRSPEGGHGNTHQYSWYSCLENPMDRGIWQITVHGVKISVRYDLATKQQCFFTSPFFYTSLLPPLVQKYLFKYHICNNLSMLVQLNIWNDKHNGSGVESTLFCPSFGYSIGNRKKKSTLTLLKYLEFIEFLCRLIHCLWKFLNSRYWGL